MLLFKLFRIQIFYVGSIQNVEVDIKIQLSYSPDNKFINKYRLLTHSYSVTQCWTKNGLISASRQNPAQ